MNIPYWRVLPRDLFNESALLKCLGKLWIWLDEHQSKAVIVTETVDHFDIYQDPASGSIFVRNIEFRVGDNSYRITRPLNARSSWSFYVQPPDNDPDGEEIAVFEDDGSITDEFKAFIEYH